jgi:hypothetical protein
VIEQVDLVFCIPTNGREEIPEKGHWISIIKMQGNFLHQAHNETRDTE